MAASFEVYTGAYRELVITKACRITRCIMEDWKVVKVRIGIGAIRIEMLTSQSTSHITDFKAVAQKPRSAWVVFGQQ